MNNDWTISEDDLQEENIPGVETIDEPKIKKPNLYKVVCLNDDFTPIDWVVAALIRFFQRTQQEAEVIAMAVHKGGKGIAGIYTLDIAETKSHLVNAYAEVQGHPFKTIVEEC